MPGFLRGSIIYPYYNGSLAVFHGVGGTGRASKEAVLLLYSVITYLIVTVTLATVLVRQRVGRRGTAVTRRRRRVATLGSAVSSLTMTARRTSVPSGRVCIIRPKSGL